MTIEYKGYKVFQASNNHISIFKGEELAGHISANKKRTEEELKKDVDSFLDVTKDLDKIWEDSK